MSTVIAFDIAVVAQKVKVQCWGPVWSEKVGGGSIVGRMAIRAPDGANKITISSANQRKDEGNSSLFPLPPKSQKFKLDSNLSLELDEAPYNL